MGLLDDLTDWLNQEEKDRGQGGMEKDEGVTRLFSATDVHGSTVCWRKFLNSAEFYSADVLVLGGDTTGKAIMPIIEENGSYRFNRGGQEQRVEESGLEDRESRFGGVNRVRDGPRSWHTVTGSTQLTVSHLKTGHFS